MMNVRKGDLIESLSHFAGLVKVDPLLLTIPVVIGEDSFFELMKTMAGKTLTFPSLGDLKRINEVSTSLRNKLNNDKRNSKIDMEMSQLVEVLNAYSSPSILDKVKTKITSQLMIGYFSTVFTRLSNMSDLINKKQSELSAVELYEYRLKDMKAYTKFINAYKDLESQQLKASKRTKREEARADGINGSKVQRKAKNG